MKEALGGGCHGALGDFLRAMRHTRASTPEQNAQIAHMLGFGRPASLAKTPAASSLASSPVEESQDHMVPPPSQIAAQQIQDSLPARGVAPLVVRYAHQPPPLQRLPPWLEGVAALERQPEGASPGGPKKQSLLDPLRWRALVAGALSTRSSSGEPDIAATVARIASGETLRELPRRPCYQSAASVQLLLDCSRAMLPFAEDLNDYEQQVRRLVGEPALNVLRFDAAPLRGAGPGPRRLWRDYREAHRPTAGTLVLVITDLGLGFDPEGSAPASESEWLDFHELIQAARANLRLLVPYAAERWPTRLARRLPAIAWDRSLSVSQVVRFGRKGMRP